MKTACASLICLCLFLRSAYSQSKFLRPAAIGISFTLNDYLTPQRIRSTSLSDVLRNHGWAKLGEMGSGLAIHYFRGVQNHIDFAATLSGTFVNTTSQDRTSASGDFLLEGDASANFKLFTDRKWFTPYLITGIGASRLRKTYGAIIPLGFGVKVNLFDEAAIFLSSQYRIPIIDGANNYHFTHSLGIAGIIGKRRNQENPN